MLLKKIRRLGSLALSGTLVLCTAASIAAGVAANPMPDVEAKTYKILLDPGHCASHTGAHYGKLKEEELTLKVAKYAKAELQKYKNVKVYMTRTGAGCPHNAGAAPSDDNYKRCVYSNSIKADAYISIHMNMAGTGTANGCEVYYQQRKTSTYNKAAAKKSKKIAEKIQKNLVALGLVNRGIKYRVTETGTKYPDGGLADYYAVIKYNRLNNIPAVIVEHAFIDGSKDYTFLSKTANLKKLGIADATGVAQQFGLTKLPQAKIKTVKATGFNGLKVTWGAVTGASSYKISRATSASGTYTQVGTSKTTSFTDNTCTPGVQYWYKVAGADSTSTGTLSAAVSAKANASKVPAVTVTDGVFNQTKLTYSAVSNATGYFVYRRKGTTGDYTKVGSTNASELDYTDETAVCGTSYTYKVSAYRTYNKKNYIGSGKTAAFTPDKRLVTVSANVVSGATVKVEWTKVEGVTGYKVYRKPVGGTYTLLKNVNNVDTLAYNDSEAKYDGEYIYLVRPYRKYNDKNYLGVAPEGVSVVITGMGPAPVEDVNETETTESVNTKSVAADPTEALHPILGTSSVTAKQMVSYYESKVGASTYPAKTYSSKGAATITEFANIVVEEAKAEGVLPELVFAQVCQETGYLRFGGQVKAEQCNFAGLGATNGGAAGATFKDVRTGIRAQVQHLKLYANEKQTKTNFKSGYECVDQRYSASLAGKAPYIEWLEMRNNPYNKDGQFNYGWCITYDGSDYGAILLTHINKIKAMK